MEHVIETEGQPLYARPRRLDQVKLAQAKAEFQKLESAGLIRRSDSPWASPLHMVQKSYGSWRPCDDYHRLNNVTRPDLLLQPHPQDVRGLQRFLGMINFTAVFYLGLQELSALSLMP